jgi:uncharacterized protein
MILEGIITTEASNGGMHISPIGPHIDRNWNQWTLKPFQSSQTFANLKARSRGVFHVVDDGLLMVESVLGLCNPPHAPPAARFAPDQGWILENACRVIPLSIDAWDLDQERAVARCSTGPCIEQRPFWGWNRAAHSLLELAILMSRRHWLDRDLLLSEWQRHQVIVEKTGGDRELLALELIRQTLDAAAE